MVVTEDKSTEKETKVETLVVSHENTITENKFTNDGVVITGYLKNNVSEDIIHLKNESSDITFPMAKNGEYYSGTITFTEVPNGVYTLYINEIPLKNNMEVVNRIVRSKVGDKLITFNYDDGVALSVEDFSYQYDLLIDVGHGGSDNGASNKYIYEKEMNLIISKYEKCRYEEMGLKVQLVREDDTYGNMMGPENWNILTRRAYYMGYYGAVSKIVYSNHNNSTPSNKVKGFEILTPAVSDLSREVKILNDVKLAFPNEETSARAYARNYYGGGIYTSSAGQNYDFKNYYAVIRVPYELYNTKVVIYEGAYLSNLDDFEFFWNEGNWKKISEIKIKNKKKVAIKRIDSLFEDLIDTKRILREITLLRFMKNPFIVELLDIEYDKSNPDFDSIYLIFECFLHENYYNTPAELEKIIAQTKQAMLDAAKDLEFLEAARLRDEMIKLQNELLKMKK